MADAATKPLIFLDRDGVLNDVVVHPEFGTLDSPLNVSEVQVYPWVPEALGRLTEAGFTLVIVTNQPAAAKGKTTRENLLAVQEAVVRGASSAGARIASSHLCFHRAEDACACRKPRTGLLQAAFAQHPGHTLAASWMAGDGITDVQAGAAFGVKTAFLGPRKCDACKLFLDKAVKPDYWGTSLVDFVDELLK